jgi:chemotaxis methyl-accepting protein methylase
VDEASEVLNPLLTRILREVGLSPAAYRASSLNRRLPAVLRALKAATPEAGLKAVESNPAKARSLVNVVLLGVTSFHRDEQVFRLLAEEVLPDLRLRNGTPRIWSAACSDGRELYSVALMLAGAGQLGQGVLLGTDCRSEAIAQAAQGSYERSALVDVPPEWLHYFDRSPSAVRVKETVRRWLQWEVHDLMKSRPEGLWDLVLWRNMAIYLRGETARSLWSLMADAVAPGGYLICGKAERPASSLPFRRVGPCTFQRTPASPGAKGGVV